MRSDHDTYRKHRLEVLEDLQRYSRRAKGIAPVASYEDIGIIRNTIRPALDLDKIGAVVEFVPDPSDLTLILDLGGLDKIAGWLGDVWEGIKGGATRLGRGIKTLGTDVLWPVLRSPYDIGKSIGTHVRDAWRSDSPWYSNLGRSAVGVVSGVMEPLEDIASGAYRSGRDIATGAMGLIPGVELGFQKALRTPYLGGALRTADVAGEALSRLAPSVAAFLLPGGQGAGAAGIAANLGRLGLSVARGAPVVEGLLGQWPHTGGDIGTGLRATLMGERHDLPQLAPTVAQGLPQGQIQPQEDYLRQFGSAVSGVLNPSTLIGTMMPGVTPEQFRNITGMMAQVPQSFMEAANAAGGAGGMGSLIGQLPQGMLLPAAAPAG